jgi:hypothetical protein
VPPEIAVQIPSNEIGSGYFQETKPEHLFAQCSHYCELVSQPEQMPRVLEIAMQTALSQRGVSVVAIPGDVAPRDAIEQEPRLHFPQPKPTVCPSDEEMATLAKVLNKAKKITILGGAGCAGAHAELIELAGKLNAVLRQNSVRTENSAIPCRDGLSHPGYPFILERQDSLPEERPRGLPVYIRMEEPRRFREATLIRIRQPSRSGGAALPVAHGKGRDLRLWCEFCRLVFPSRVRDACGPRGNSEYTQREDVSGGVRPLQ